MRVYVSGPISNGRSCTEGEITDNLNAGIRISLHLQFLGYTVLSPYLFSAYWVSKGYSYEEMMACSYALLLEASAILMLPGWSESEGAKRELQLSRELGKLVFYSVDEL